VYFNHGLRVLVCCVPSEPYADVNTVEYSQKLIVPGMTLMAGRRCFIEVLRASILWLFRLTIVFFTALRGIELDWHGLKC